MISEPLPAEKREVAEWARLHGEWLKEVKPKMYQFVMIYFILEVV